MSGTHEGTVLALDFGTRKIGVALGNTLSGTARALATLDQPSRAARMDAIAGLVAEWQPAVLVVGRPLHADGTEHDVTRLADAFARELAKRFSLPVEQVDERYTTQIARIRSDARPRRNDPGHDAHAARIILQSWLDQR